MNEKQHELFDRATRVLGRLGVTANYAGFYQTAYAVSLAAEEPCRLQLVTKWLYPDVASAYDTCSDNVRKNINKICSIVWERNPALLSETASFKLKKKPGTSEFLAILATYIIINPLR